MAWLLPMVPVALRPDDLIIPNLGGWKSVGKHARTGTPPSGHSSVRFFLVWGVGGGGAGVGPWWWLHIVIVIGKYSVLVTPPSASASLASLPRTLAWCMFFVMRKYYDCRLYLGQGFKKNIQECRVYKSISGFNAALKSLEEKPSTSSACLFQFLVYPLSDPELCPYYWSVTYSVLTLYSMNHLPYIYLFPIFFFHFLLLLHLILHLTFLQSTTSINWTFHFPPGYSLPCCTFETVSQTISLSFVYPTRDNRMRNFPKKSAPPGKISPVIKIKIPINYPVDRYLSL